MEDEKLMIPVLKWTESGWIVMIGEYAIPCDDYKEAFFFRKWYKDIDLGFIRQWVREIQIKARQVKV